MENACKNIVKSFVLPQQTNKKQNKTKSFVTISIFTSKALLAVLWFSLLT
jgi:hypothetical protein